MSSTPAAGGAGSSKDINQQVANEIIQQIMQKYGKQLIRLQRKKVKHLLNDGEDSDSSHRTVRSTSHRGRYKGSTVTRSRHKKPMRRRGNASDWETDHASRTGRPNCNAARGKGGPGRAAPAPKDFSKWKKRFRVLEANFERMVMELKLYQLKYGIDRSIRERVEKFGELQSFQSWPKSTQLFHPQLFDSFGEEMRRSNISSSSGSAGGKHHRAARSDTSHHNIAPSSGGLDKRKGEDKKPHEIEKPANIPGHQKEPNVAFGFQSPVANDFTESYEDEESGCYSEDVTNLLRETINSVKRMERKSLEWNPGGGGRHYRSRVPRSGLASPCYPAPPVAQNPELDVKSQLKSGLAEKFSTKIFRKRPLRRDASSTKGCLVSSYFYASNPDPTVELSHAKYRQSFCTP